MLGQFVRTVDAPASTEKKKRIENTIWLGETKKIARDPFVVQCVMDMPFFLVLFLVFYVFF